MNAIDIMLQNREMITQEQIDEFWNALEQFKLHPVLDNRLFLIFTDYPGNSDGLKYLWDYICELDNSKTIEILLLNTAQLLKQANDWLDIFYSDYLVVQSTRDSLKLQIKSSSVEVRENAKSILLRLKTKNYGDSATSLRLNHFIDETLEI